MSDTRIREKLPKCRHGRAAGPAGPEQGAPFQRVSAPRGRRPECKESRQACRQARAPSCADQLLRSPTTTRMTKAATRNIQLLLFGSLSGSLRCDIRDCPPHCIVMDSIVLGSAVAHRPALPRHVPARLPGAPPRGRRCTTRARLRARFDKCTGGAARRTDAHPVVPVAGGRRRAKPLFFQRRYAMTRRAGVARRRLARAARGAPRRHAPRAGKYRLVTVREARVTIGDNVAATARPQRTLRRALK